METIRIRRTIYASRYQNVANGYAALKQNNVHELYGAHYFVTLDLRVMKTTVDTSNWEPDASQ